MYKPVICSQDSGDVPKAYVESINSMGTWKPTLILYWKIHQVAHD